MLMHYTKCTQSKFNIFFYIFVTFKLYLVYQVHIADGVQFVREISNSASAGEACDHENGVNSKVDIIIIDVDSADSR